LRGRSGDVSDSSQYGKLAKNGLAKLGFKFYLKDEDESRLLLTVLYPRGKKFNFTDYHDYLYKQNITIYPSKIDKPKCFRIANIGNIYPKDIKLFLHYTKIWLDKR